MTANYSVQCMMCGRSVGLIGNGVFWPTPEAPIIVKKAGRSCCGFCGGNLILEYDDSLVSRPMDYRHDADLRRAS